ncbi:hypothetical protein RRG08_048087 [Elysia crispata]|uniref:Uncharacterized protein n=1 Tax=Elysia crispata TaxID=231223 RepID=A0AAE1B524_9GAST|nr:hypothetical protein RRG08_048087 [Elysia crispata]
MSARAVRLLAQFGNSRPGKLFLLHSSPQLCLLDFVYGFQFLVKGCERQSSEKKAGSWQSSHGMEKDQEFSIIMAGLSAHMVSLSTWR